VIESRTGKYAVVLLLLVLAAILGTSRPKKPHIVYPLAAILAVTAACVAWRVKAARPIEPSFPLGDAVAFIATVPSHVKQLGEWARQRGIPIHQRPLRGWTNGFGHTARRWEKNGAA